MASKQIVVSSALLGAGLALTALLLMGAKGPAPKFEEIDVERINVREPDGTLRMVISNRARFPGSPWKGEEIARPDRTEFAGMLFVNDEGTENGGLIQKGVIDEDGRASAGLSLTFDRFRQDQVLQLLHAEKGGRAYSMLSINDETDGTRLDVMQRAERMREIRGMDKDSARAAMQAMREQRQLPSNRVRLGTSMDGAAVLSLADANGKPRLMLTVSAAGEPIIRMLDDAGEPVRTIGLDGAAASAPAKRPETRER